MPDIYEIYGEVAYEGYREKSEGKSLASGEPIPMWADLPGPIQEAWNASAKAIIEHFASDAAKWSRALKEQPWR